MSSECISPLSIWFTIPLEMMIGCETILKYNILSPSTPLALNVYGNYDGIDNPRKRFKHTFICVHIKK